MSSNTIFHALNKKKGEIPQPEKIFITWNCWRVWIFSGLSMSSAAKSTPTATEEPAKEPNQCYATKNIIYEILSLLQNHPTYKQRKTVLTVSLGGGEIHRNVRKVIGCVAFSGSIGEVCWMDKQQEPIHCCHIPHPHRWRSKTIGSEAWNREWCYYVDTVEVIS